MLARSVERLEGAASTIGDAALPISTDVGDPQSVRRAFERIAATCDRLDVVVNNAGVATLTSIEEATDADLARTFATNLLGPIHMTRSAIPLLRNSGGGDIINISSESTMMPFPYLALYAASKGGLETFGRAAQAELKPIGVRVSTLVCGATETEFGTDWNPGVVAKFLEAAQQSGHLAFVSAGSLLRPDDIADALVHIATRPPHQTIDVMHVRSHSTSDGHEVFEKALSAEEVS
jgi:NAD(P)-dependent dehydrogenase (short-subunit alcohol dehydrogenase family)